EPRRLEGTPGHGPPRRPAPQVHAKGYSQRLDSARGDELGHRRAGARDDRRTAEHGERESSAAPRAASSVADVAERYELPARDVQDAGHAEHRRRADGERPVQPGPERLNAPKRPPPMLGQDRVQGPPARARQTEVVDARALEHPRAARGL